MSSSESEDDFMSAEEGSDNEEDSLSFSIKKPLENLDLNDDINKDAIKEDRHPEPSAISPSEKQQDDALESSSNNPELSEPLEYGSQTIAETEKTLTPLLKEKGQEKISDNVKNSNNGSLVSEKFEKEKTENSLGSHSQGHTVASEELKNFDAEDSTHVEDPQSTDLIESKDSKNDEHINSEISSSKLCDKQENIDRKIDSFDNTDVQENKKELRNENMTIDQKDIVQSNEDINDQVQPSIIKNNDKEKEVSSRRNDEKISHNDSGITSIYSFEEDQKFPEFSSKTSTTNNQDSIKLTEKPLKQSSIGKKKPREKLQSKIGGRKLGTKISKPLDMKTDQPVGQIPKFTEQSNSSNSTVKSTSEDGWGKTETEGGFDGKEGNDGWSDGWGNWGSSIMSAASNLSQEVTKGVGTVVELVEDSMGVPSPEELAREKVERDKWAEENTPKTDNPETQQTFGFGGFSSLVSGVGSKFVMGGLDTLEIIGKKTMTVLHDTDPSIRDKKQALINQVNKPNLSAVLREARELANSNTMSMQSGESSSPTGTSKMTFHLLWDNTTGPAHLEALSLIASQSSRNISEIMTKLDSGDAQLVEQLNRQIGDLAEINDEDLEDDTPFSSQIASILQIFNLPFNANDLSKCWSDLSMKSFHSSENENYEESDPASIEKNVLQSCVSLVEKIASIAHKAAEKCLSDPHKLQLKPVELAESYRKLVMIVTSHIDSCADSVCTKLSSVEGQESLNPVITNIFMQACEGTSCLQQSLLHLCTTLQLLQVRKVQES